MSSAYGSNAPRGTPWRVLQRIVLNTLIAYGVAAMVTFCMILVAEVLSPSEFNPYIGQAIGGTVWTIGWFSFGSPIVLAGAGVLDWLLRRVQHPRRAVAVFALIPAAFWMIFALQATVALSYAAWCLMVGLGTARFMRVPPPLKTA